MDTLPTRTNLIKRELGSKLRARGVIKEQNADNIGDISPILSVFHGTDILIGIQRVVVKISRYYR